MSIRRPRGPKPTLKHLAFLEAMTEYPAQSAEWRALHASLLTLRLFDEWMLLGAVVAEGASPMMRATRGAVDALHEDSELQYHLARVVDGVLMLRDADARAVLPRLAALAELLRTRGATALASDIDQVVGNSTPGSPRRVSAPTEAMA